MSLVGNRRKRLQANAKRASKLLTVSILCFLVSLCLVGPFQLVKAAGGTVYYFQPVQVRPELEGNYYMDTLLPKGPMVERNASSFHTRILVKNYAFHWFNISIRMNPSNTMRTMRMKIGWSDYAFDATILSEITLIVFDQATIGYAISQKTIAAGQRLYISIEIDDGYLVFGDSEHRSAIELKGLDLSGQPIPEFPLPVVTLLTTLVMTFATMKLSIKKKTGHTPARRYCGLNRGNLLVLCLSAQGIVLTRVTVV